MSKPIMESTSPMLEDEIENRLNAGENHLDLAIEFYQRILEMMEACEDVKSQWIEYDPLCYYYKNDCNKCLLKLNDKSCESNDSLYSELNFAIFNGANDQEDCCKDLIKRLIQIRDQNINIMDQKLTTKHKNFKRKLLKYISSEYWITFEKLCDEHETHDQYINDEIVGKICDELVKENIIEESTVKTFEYTRCDDEKYRYYLIYRKLKDLEE